MRARVVAAIGLIVGAEIVMLLPARWLVAPDADPGAAHAVWACPMLCTRLDRPGRCPVCDMELTRIADTGSQVVVAADQARTIGLRTVKAERRVLEKRIRALGTIDYSDRRLRAIDSFSPGGADSRPFSVRFDAYDADIPWLAVGQSAEVVLDAWPGQVLAGAVENVSLAVSPQTHATRVRVVVDNPQGRAASGTFARVTIRAVIGPDGRAAPPALAGRYACRVHPDVRAAVPGECPLCRLPLEIDTSPPATGPEPPKVLSLPRDAVLSAGARHVVYVKVAPDTFELREVQIGPRAGDLVMVTHGLAEAEVVAERGSFLIDSQMQLSGRPSLIAR